VLLAAASVALAQSTTGTVVGTVKDTSGAAVSGAMVKLLNTGTNAARSTVSSDMGAFQLPNLDVGSYQLEISAAGFEQLKIAPFDLVPARPSVWTPS
jgi:Carboxypeptidase regulatory-like domain